jgi:polyisoprenoid-binding protein YceI
MTTLTETGIVPQGTWSVDQAHSSANFEVEHGGLSVFRGGFKPIEASLIADESGVRLEGSVDVKTISINDENIYPHLLSPEFFDADRNPKVTFHSTEISGEADDLRVKGELSMAGETREVEATGRLRGPVSFGPGAEKISLELATVVDRTEFGMNWQMDLPAGGQALANDVRLVVSLELNKE